MSLLHPIAIYGNTTSRGVRQASIEMITYHDTEFTTLDGNIDWDRIVPALSQRISAQKRGSFTATGNDEYKAMCAKLAAEHGFKITNPETFCFRMLSHSLLPHFSRCSFPRKHPFRITGRSFEMGELFFKSGNPDRSVV